MSSSLRATTVLFAARSDHRSPVGFRRVAVVRSVHQLEREQDPARSSHLELVALRPLPDAGTDLHAVDVRGHSVVPGVIEDVTTHTNRHPPTKQIPTRRRIVVVAGRWTDPQRRRVCPLGGRPV